nr:hematopoietic lineage cell specific protein [Hymenolepis microstoma]
MADDDDWGITPDYKNVMTEKEQRFGVKAVPGRIGYIDMNELRKAVVKDDEESKKNAPPSASYGYGGKFGVEKDRMDKSAVGTDYHPELNKHASQQDYSKGFGGRYGVQADRQDKAAVGYDHHEELSKHASQKDYSIGFGGKYGVQSDRVDSSSVGYKDANESAGLHPSQQRAEVTGGQNKASELRMRFEKLALDMNKPAERPSRPDVGKIKLPIFAQPKPTEEPKLEPRPANVKSLIQMWASVDSPTEPSNPQIPKSSTPLVPEVEPAESPKAPKSSEQSENATPTSQPQVVFGMVPAFPLEAAKGTSITAVAIFDFQASQSDELSFKEGDKIVDIDKFDEAWWSGRIGDRIGIFPANRVQDTAADAAISSSGATGSRQEVVSSITAMALYDFAASQSDELFFKAGDEIVDIVKFDKEWWSGRIGDRPHLFIGFDPTPGTSDASPNAHGVSHLISHGDELSFNVGEEIVDINKFDEMWWAGRIGNRRGIFPANFVKESKVVTVKPTAPNMARANCGITATAIYDFAGSQPDELSFKAGDEIVDIDKFDTQWWAGRIGDRRGIFPTNHVFEN